MDKRRRLMSREQGTSLIEMMIALLVLLVGLIGAMVLVSLAIANNARSKRDSTDAALVEMIIDQISSVPVGSSTTSLTITDCGGNKITVNTAGTSTGVGANVSGGSIDFTQSFASVTSGYAMQYTVCGVSTGLQTVYDVRWNVQTLPSGKADFVTVGARFSTVNNPLLFALPFSVRTVVGNSGN